MGLAMETAIIIMHLFGKKAKKVLPVKSAGHPGVGGSGRIREKLQTKKGGGFGDSQREKRRLRLFGLVGVASKKQKGGGVKYEPSPK